jgi:phospholipid/cholesterol/gamma-HCH transport system ATP-binding protein
MAEPIPTAPAIEVTGLSCGYDGNVVLKDVSFTVPRGEIFFVIGGSGCGKSTLLRNLIGLHQPFAGKVKFLGRSFTDADLTARRKRLKTFGVLYQGGALWSSLTLRQNIALPMEEHTALSAREIAELSCLKLAQVGLTGFEDYYPAEISGGMKKRAGLARALSLDPELLFLDEPTAGLDPISANQFDELIKQLQKSLGLTVFMVTHDIDTLRAITDRIVVLVNKKLVVGTIAELRKNDDPWIKDYFSGVRGRAALASEEAR